MMKTTTIKNSSIIKRVAYCSTCKTFRVKFINGGVYAYSQVPDSIVHDLIVRDNGVASVGRFYHQNIKGKFPSVTLVDSFDAEGTRNYRLDGNHICPNPRVSFSGQEKIALEMFGGSAVIETVYRIKGDTQVYTSRQLLEQAIEKKQQEEAERELVNKLHDMLSKFDFYSSAVDAQIVDFITQHRKELKTIL